MKGDRLRTERSAIVTTLRSAQMAERDARARLSDFDRRHPEIIGAERAKEVIVAPPPVRHNHTFGDHDPDGLEIPESCLRTIEEMQRHGTAPGGLPPIRLERIALTREQIDEHNPPPFPAKETSSRYAKYYRETGLDEAWELDALEPAILDQLIRDSVAEHFDEGIHEANEASLEGKRRDLRARILSDGWVATATGWDDEE